MKSMWMWVVCMLVWSLSAGAEHDGVLGGGNRGEGEGENTALKALGITETRVAFTLYEAPLTFEEATRRCRRWNMYLPDQEDLEALKPHLRGLLSGLSDRDHGFLWAGDFSLTREPQKAFSLDVGRGVEIPKDRKGIALCVRYRWQDNAWRYSSPSVSAERKHSSTTERGRSRTYGESNPFEPRKSGFGVTVDGKFGVAPGGGPLVIPFDGSSPSIGIGF